MPLVSVSSLSISPVLLRELKVALRQPMRGGRFVAAAIVAGVLLFGLTFAIDHSQSKVGHVLFDLLLIGGLIAVALAAGRGCHLFADERRNGTLGILFGTGISPTEVLIGKLAATLIVP